MDRLNHYLAEQEKKLKENTPSELEGLAENLFVDQGLSDIVYSNLEEVRRSLQELKLRLEKIHFAYAGV